MDPNENLKQQRELINKLLYPDDGYATSEIAQWGEDLAALAEALDEWICQGGFLPKEWRDRK